MRILKAYLKFLDGCSIDDLSIPELDKDNLKKYVELTGDFLVHDISQKTGFKIHTIRALKRIHKAHEEGKMITVTSSWIREVKN